MEPLTIINNNDNLKLEKLSSLNKREAERQLNLQKKKIDGKLNLAENEKLEVFHKLFSEKQVLIGDCLSDCENVPKDLLPERLNVISKEINDLQKYVANSSIFLRNYDLQRCQGIVQDLSTALKECEEKLLPKKKFSFKNKTKPKPATSVPGADETDSVRKYRINEESFCGFSDKLNETLHMNSMELFKNDITLTNLENCKVYLKGAPSTLHLNHLKNCYIFSGPVSTSVFAENCFDTTLIIACQQLRLHASRNVQIYLHVTSRAIMEDCKDIQVAPYNWSYDNIEKDFESAGLDKTINNWKCIDDFDWLNVEKHSPNWKEVEETDRVVEWGLN